MNLDRIEAILQLLYRQQHVGEVAIEGEGWRLQARKGHGVPTVMPSLPVDESPPAETSSSVRATNVGVFRVGNPRLVCGDLVKPGSILGQIDSMRILNPIVAEQGGLVAEVRVEDGDPVEFGQELFVLVPEPPMLGGEMNE